MLLPFKLEKRRRTIGTFLKALMPTLLLSTLYIQMVFATTYTQYPPYDVGFSGGGKVEQGGVANYGHYVSLLNGTAKLYTIADAAFIGGAMAEAWGYMGPRWTAPGGGGGGGGGGCPYISTWDGDEYVLDNNLMPRSELSNGSDVEDYYRLEQPLVARNGKYQLLLSEFEQEHSFIDQIKLLAVDHESDIKIAMTPNGEIVTYKNPVEPISAVDKNGNDSLKEISHEDGNVLDPSTYFYGQPGDYLILNFGQVSPKNAKLIVRDDMKKAFECILVQVMDGNGAWQTVEVLVPRNYWSVETVDLAPYVIEGQNLLVKLYWKYRHRVDYVGLETSKQEDFQLNNGNLVSAVHIILGDVKSQLLSADGVYSELLPNKQIELAFTLPRNIKETRTFILCTKGHYVRTSENDPIVTVTSKLTLKGYAEAVAYALNSAGARAKYVFQIWLWVYDLTTGSYVTQTLIYEKSEEAIAPGGFIPDIKSYTWNYDQDVISTFSATGGHTYDIYIGVRIQAVTATISIGGSGAVVDFDSYTGYGEEKINGYAIARYISLSW